MSDNREVSVDKCMTLIDDYSLLHLNLKYLFYLREGETNAFSARPVQSLDSVSCIALFIKP